MRELSELILGGESESVEFKKSTGSLREGNASMNLLEKLKQPENRKLEFKREIPGKSDLLKTIIAFANGAGGGPNPISLHTFLC